MLDFKKIMGLSVKPELYQKGTAVMWTDAYISKQLLEVHLNPEVDLASRKKKTIESTVKWILEKAGKNNLKILDLGCGPGLYSQLLSEKGHTVTGVDFSDFGVLSPDDRATLLSNIRRALKPGGFFLFDVLNDNQMNQNVSDKSWDVSKKGFWRDNPYLVLSDSFLYPKSKVVLYQHCVIDKDHCETYRFWTHFFSHEDLKNILTENHFGHIEFYENVLPESDIGNGQNVTFCMTAKNTCACNEKNVIYKN